MGCGGEKDVIHRKYTSNLSSGRIKCGLV